MLRVLVFLLLVGSAGAVRGQAPAELKTRDALWKRQQEFAKQRRFADAIAAAERVLAIERRALGESDPKAIDSLSRLAYLHEQAADFLLAEKVRGEVLVLRIKVFGPQHWRVTDARLAIDHVKKLQLLTPAERADLDRARVLRQDVVDLDTKKRYDDALPPARQSLAIREKLLGENHPDTAQAINLLGVVLDHQKDYAAALPFFERALAVRIKIQGEEYPTTATVYSNIGNLRKAQGDVRAAQAAFEKTLAIRRKTQGDEHQETATAFANLEKLLTVATLLNNLANVYNQRHGWKRPSPFAARPWVTRIPIPFPVSRSWSGFCAPAPTRRSACPAIAALRVGDALIVRAGPGSMAKNAPGSRRRPHCWTAPLS
jgi:tetratricopeptide (TPR) repeat protein